MTIVEFIMERLAMLRANADKTFVIWDFSPEGSSSAKEDIEAFCDAFEEIIDYHNNWVVALETPIKYSPEFDRNYNPLSIDSYLMKASSEIQFLTEKAYRQKFGSEPPTSPMIKSIARIWKDHPDYQEEWA